jgi:hypothetical protein
MAAMRTPLALLIALVPAVAAADKLDDAVAKTDKAFDAYKGVEKQYATLYTSWERYYKPIDTQYPLVVAARKKADDACAKNKRSKNCHDFTLAYAAEHKKYNSLVWDKDNADPKQEYAPEALKPVERDMTQKKDAFEKSKEATIKLFEEAYKKVKTKAEKDQLDAKLAAREDKRNDKFAAGRSSAADAKMPKGNPNSSSSGSSSRTNGYDPTKTINDTINRW